MSRRKTVSLNLDFVLKRIKSEFRSNVVFCEAMGFWNRNSWVSDWKRGKNLPSPEEAAKMCAVLQATPEELLCDPGDVEEVQKLLDEEEKKSPAAQTGDGEREQLLSAIDRALFELTEEQKLEALRYIWSLQGKGENND